MLEISNINVRQPDQRWYLFEGQVQCHNNTNQGIKNYIDLVKTVLFVDDYLNAHHDQLFKEQIKEVSSNLLQQALKANRHLEEQNTLCSLIVKIILYLFAGSTLNGAIDGLMETTFNQLKVENDFSAKALYPELMQDAQKALESREAYLETGRKYAPSKNYYKAKNPILVHLNEALVEQWAEARKLAMESKDDNDWRLICHCDTAMQIAKISMQLAIAWELELLDGDKDDNVVSQIVEDGFIWRVYSQFTGLYRWLHSIHLYDPVAKTWASAIKADSSDEMDLFYQSGTHQNAWREDYNEIMMLLEKTVDIDKMLSHDARYTTGLDTKEISDPDYLSGRALPENHIAHGIRSRMSDVHLVSDTLVIRFH